MGPTVTLWSNPATAARREPGEISQVQSLRSQSSQPQWV